MEVSTLYLAPESDEWEEIEWDETIEKIPSRKKSTFAPIYTWVVLILLRFVFVNNFY
jgi:hypothetical protein